MDIAYDTHPDGVDRDQMRRKEAVLDETRFDPDVAAAQVYLP